MWRVLLIILSGMYLTACQSTSIDCERVSRMASASATLDSLAYMSRLLRESENQMNPKAAKKYYRATGDLAFVAFMSAEITGEGLTGRQKDSIIWIYENSEEIYPQLESAQVGFLKRRLEPLAIKLQQERRNVRSDIGIQ